MMSNSFRNFATSKISQMNKINTMYGKPYMSINAIRLQ